MLRLVLGLVKGGVIGAAVGGAAYSLGLTGTFHWLTYGVTGALVGLLVGRPFWSHLRDRSSTVLVAVIKALVGLGVGVGLYALVAKMWGGMDLTIGGETRNLYDWPYLMAGAIGALYGAWVEVDDAPSAGKNAKRKPVKRT